MATRTITVEAFSIASPATGVSPVATSAFGYFGAKRRLALEIARMLPPHNAWVEAFCGSAAVTMAKRPAPIEVINDADSHIVNVFERLREQPDELIRLIELTPYARGEFENAHIENGGAGKLEQARRFLVASMMAVNGAIGKWDTGIQHSGFSQSPSYTRKGHEARVSRWNSMPERLKNVVQRLKQVRIENRDARELFKMFLNRPATLVYLDPPYLVERSHGYKIDANEKGFHEELLELCVRAKCMVLASGYDNKLYDSHLNKERGWKRQVIETHTRNTNGKDFDRSEILWSNEAFHRASATGRVPIRLSKKEKRNGKVNPLRK